MRIAIIDAQGAGLGQTTIKRLKKEAAADLHIVALGTNPTATDNMLKAGADEGITGEKDICSFLYSHQIECIIGPIGIMCSGGIQGEITPLMSSAIFAQPCTKYIIPLQKHGIYIPGTRSLQIKEIITEIIEDINLHIDGR